MLYEHFNTTNQTSPHFEPHMNFVADITATICGMVEFEEPSKRCDFVHHTETCKTNLFVINYIAIYYCFLQPEHTVTKVVDIALFVLFCMYVFDLLGLTASGFLTPSLKVLSKIMKLSETVAGDTLLSFCNSAPDVLTNMAGIQQENTSIFSDVYGSALCSVLIVSGTLIAFQPIIVEPFPFIRDVCFLLLDVVFVDFCIVVDQTLSIVEAILIILLYFVYIFVVLFDQYLLHVAEKKLAAQLEKSEQADEKLWKLRSETTLQFTTRKDQNLVNELDTEFAFHDLKNSKNAYILWIFFTTLRPYDVEEWKKAKWFKRILICIRMPVVLILKIVVPVVDFELPMHGWCKLLHTLQVIIVPTFLTACLWQFKPLLFGYPICMYMAILMTPFALAIYFTTRTDVPPKYFKFFSLMAIVVSAYLVFALAKECVSILDLIGITTHCSSAFLNCTLLAFGNCVGGLISNFALLKQGYSKMGLSSCYGGPLLNSLLSLGITYLYQALMHENLSFSVGVGAIGATCTVFLVISLLLILVAAFTTHFILRRSQGVLILVLYSLFLTFCLLCEFNIIHPYGTDHRMETKPIQAD